MDEAPLPPVTPATPPPDLPPPPPITPLPAGDLPAGAPPPAGAVNLRVVAAAKSADDDESPPGGLASFNTRMTAAGIDAVVMVGLYLLVLWILPAFLAWLVAVGYWVTRDSLAFLGGQSVGKKAMKLRVVTLEGKSLVNNWEPALVRNGVLIIPLFVLVELFILLTREGKPEQGRRLGDEWSKTEVILAPDPPPAV